MARHTNAIVDRIKTGSFIMPEQLNMVAMQVRVMPNTPCLIGQAASAYVLGNHATNDDAAKIYTLLSSAGMLRLPSCGLSSC